MYVYGGGKNIIHISLYIIQKHNEIERENGREESKEKNFIAFSIDFQTIEAA